MKEFRVVAINEKNEKVLLSKGWIPTNQVSVEELEQMAEMFKKMGIKYLIEYRD